MTDITDTYFIGHAATVPAISLLVGSRDAARYASAVTQMFQTFPEVTQCTFKTASGIPARVAVAGDMSKVDGAINAAVENFKRHPTTGDAKDIEKYTDLRCEIPSI